MVFSADCESDESFKSDYKKTTLFCFIVLQRFSSLIKAELSLDTSHRSVLSAIWVRKASLLDVNFAEIRDIISLFVIY